MQVVGCSFILVLLLAVLNCSQFSCNHLSASGRAGLMGTRKDGNSLTQSTVPD